MASRACSSWMPPTAPTRCRTSTRSKPPTRAANNGLARTRTAAWVRSTWPSSAGRMAAWIGKSCARVWSFPPASWTTWSTPTPTCRPCRSLKEAAHRARRIGLGIMGLADLMYHVRRALRLPGRPGVRRPGDGIRALPRHADQRRAGRERGPFPAIQGSIYDSADLRWTPPQPLAPLPARLGPPGCGLERSGARHPAARHPQRRPDHRRPHRHHRHRGRLRRLRLRAGLRPGLRPPRQRQRQGPAA